MKDSKPTATSRRAPTLRHFLVDAVKRFKRARLAYGQGTDNAVDEAAFLLLATLDLPIDDINAFLDRELTPAQARKVQAAIAARIATRKPAAYLLKRAYIQGVRFYVDERVIVPRSFIGELLYSGAIVGPFGMIAAPEKVRHVLDLCTGSGCLAILAAKKFPNAHIDAVELSTDALAVARRNLKEHRLQKRISLYHGDLFAPVAGRRYDLIVTNPPYVDAAAMGRLPREFRAEPRQALAGGKDGLDLVERIVRQAASHLTERGGLVCEIGRGAKALERRLPDLDLHWLPAAHAADEVFWASAAALRRL